MFVCTCQRRCVGGHLEAIVIFKVTCNFPICLFLHAYVAYDHRSLCLPDVFLTFSLSPAFSLTFREFKTLFPSTCQSLIYGTTWGENEVWSTEEGWRHIYIKSMVNSLHLSSGPANLQCPCRSENFKCGDTQTQD